MTIQIKSGSLVCASRFKCQNLATFDTIIKNSRLSLNKLQSTFPPKDAQNKSYHLLSLRRSGDVRTGPLPLASSVNSFAHVTYNQIFILEQKGICKSVYPWRIAVGYQYHRCFCKIKHKKEGVGKH